MCVFVCACVFFDRFRGSEYTEHIYVQYADEKSHHQKQIYTFSGDRLPTSWGLSLYYNFAHHNTLTFDIQTNRMKGNTQAAVTSTTTTINSTTTTEKYTQMLFSCSINRIIHDENVKWLRKIITQSGRTTGCPAKNIQHSHSLTGFSFIFIVWEYIAFIYICDVLRHASISIINTIQANGHSVIENGQGKSRVYA